MMLNSSFLTNQTVTTSPEMNESDRNERLETLVSRVEYQSFTYLCYTFVIPAICVCGFVGNVMAIAVLYRTAKQFKQSIYIYMCTLTVFDTVYMVISLLRSALSTIKNFDITLYNLIYYYGFGTLLFFDMSISNISVFMLIIMSVERFVAIRNPLRVKDALIAKKPFHFIVGSSIFVICIVIPLPFCLEMSEVVNSDNNTEIMASLKPSIEETLVYYIMLQSVFLNYIPFITILGLNIAIPIQYSVSVKSLARHTFNNPAENHLRIMATVFVVTMMYTLLALPQIFIETLSVIDRRFSIEGSEKYMFWLMQDVNNVLTNFNMAIDFIIYILMSKVYRKRFMNLLCSKPEHGDSGAYFISSSQS